MNARAPTIAARGGAVTARLAADEAALAEVVPQFVTANAVATVLKVNPGTVTLWAQQGLLPSYKLGRVWRFDVRDVAAFVQARRLPGARPRKTL